MSTGPPRDHLPWSTDHGLRACVFYQRALLDDPSAREGIYCKKCGWEVSKHPAAPPAAAAAAAAFDISTPMRQAIAEEVRSTATWWCVSLELKLRDTISPQSFRRLLDSMLEQRGWQPAGMCPPVKPGDLFVKVTFYSEHFDRAGDLCRLLNRCAQLSAAAFVQPIPRAQVTERSGRPADLSPWVYEQGDRSPRDTVLADTHQACDFPCSPTRGHDSPDGTSSATHEGAHLICVNKYKEATNALLDAIGLPTGAPERDIRVQMKRAAHNAFDDLAFYMSPVLLGGSRVLLTFHWRASYTMPVGADAREQLLADVEEARHQDLTGRGYTFDQLRRACLVNEHLVKWAAGVHASRDAATGALRDDCCDGCG